MDKRFRNKIVLVTGASRGTGKVTALLFSKEGAKVIINYHTSDYEPDADINAKKVIKEIEKIGSKALAIECDVSKEEEVEKMVSTIINKYGTIDILVNNAGIVFDTPFSKKTVKEWKRTLDTNLLGTFLCSKFVAPHMLKRGGRIINTSSTNGINNFSTESMDYDSSKAGIIILTRNLAKELAPKILVNSVAPGWVDTDMNKDLPSSFIKKETENIYLKRFAKSEEIAKAILFLASEDASYITGVTLMIDGGYG